MLSKLVTGNVANDSIGVSVLGVKSFLKTASRSAITHLAPDSQRPERILPTEVRAVMKSNGNNLKTLVIHSKVILE